MSVLGMVGPPVGIEFPQYGIEACYGCGLVDCVCGDDYRAYRDPIDIRRSAFKLWRIRGSHWSSGRDRRIVDIGEESRLLRRMPYRDYLLTTYWQAVRIGVISTIGARCERCKRFGGFDWERIHVHHLTYKNLGRETWSDVQILCRRCHENEHK